MLGVVGITSLTFLGKKENSIRENSPTVTSNKSQPAQDTSTAGNAVAVPQASPAPLAPKSTEKPPETVKQNTPETKNAPVKTPTPKKPEVIKATPKPSANTKKKPTLDDLLNKN